MKIRVAVTIFTTLAASLMLLSCTGTTDTGLPAAGGGGAPCTVTAGQVSTATYTIAWDAVTDADLAGYKIYYGVTSPLTKFNALGSIVIVSTTSSNQPSAQFPPADYSATTCTRVYIGVTALGGTAKPESALSAVQSVTIE